MKAPASHQWQKVGRHIWRCLWSGACRKAYRQPDPEDLTQSDAELQYAALNQEKAA